MSSKKVSKLLTADSPLPRELTKQFSDALKSLLTEDGSEKARYLESELLKKFADPDPGQASLRRSRAIESGLQPKSVMLLPTTVYGVGAIARQYAFCRESLQRGSWVRCAVLSRRSYLGPLVSRSTIVDSREERQPARVDVTAIQL